MRILVSFFFFFTFKFTNAEKSILDGLGVREADEPGARRNPEYPRRGRQPAIPLRRASRTTAKRVSMYMYNHQTDIGQCTYRLLVTPVFLAACEVLPSHLQRGTTLSARLVVVGECDDMAIS